MHSLTHLEKLDEVDRPCIISQFFKENPLSGLAVGHSKNNVLGVLGVLIEMDPQKKQRRTLKLNSSHWVSKAKVGEKKEMG